MKLAVLEKLQKARAGRVPVALVTDLDSGAQALLESGEMIGDVELADDALAGAVRLIERDSSGQIEAEGRRIFVHVHNPPARLIVVGAVHKIGRAHV